MSEQAKQEMSVDDLEYYVILGMSKSGKPVTMRSEGVTLDAMVAMMARAKLSVDIETTKIALESYRRDREAAQSAIVKPSGLTLPQ